MKLKMPATLFLLSFSISIFGFSQVEKGVVVGVSKSRMSNPRSFLSFPFYDNDSGLDPDPIRYNQYSINLGYQFSPKIITSLEVAMLNFADNRDMTTLQLGLVFNYRFLKQATVSPKLGIRGGSFLHSNSGSTWIAYGVVDVLASILLDRITIDLGVNLNYLQRNHFYKSEYGSFFDEYKKIKGIGLGYSFGVNYLIPANSKK